MPILEKDMKFKIDDINKKQTNTQALDELLIRSRQFLENELYRKMKGHRGGRGRFPPKLGTDEFVNDIREVLKKKPDQRLTEDIKFIMYLIDNLNIFKNSGAS